MENRAERILEARLRLRERFLAKMKASPVASDRRPLGSGPPNRHGMPRLPVGQTETEKWPVLDLGIVPSVDRANWRLVVDGAVESPISIGWSELLDLPQVESVSDFHCVTGWSRMDLRFGGVRLETVLALTRPLPEASHVLLHAHDGYTTNLPIEEAIKEDVLLVHAVDGAPLSTEHGGPCRVVTPQLYAWKGAKWIQSLEVLTRNAPGFWERNGYSDTAHPWRDDRYSQR
ncbi:MAG TPA: sulfite oxidase-like oxidoreductase [Anaeromyxobacter sp.]|nr:sulfite oxidase-like oxidoreductase [Anaeromyxobacter sp.]